MTQERNPVGWFEVPVTDIDRAIKFYEEVFGYTLEKSTLGECEMAFFPMNPEWPQACGALVKNEKYCTPSDTGVLIYFSATSGDCVNELAKIEDAGGKLLMEKTEIPENHGFMGTFIDTEGNKIAVHSMK